MTPRLRVAVIGGGWAGCAAAVALTDAGVQVALYEQARELGGRARRVMLEGNALDNGQHLLIGAYRETFGLLARVHGAQNARSLTHRLPLTLRPFGDGWAGAVKLRAPHLPAPFHLAAGLLCAGGLSWADRLALINDFRRLAASRFVRPAGETVA
ncbi:MAG: NAD(P)-binding protein, partial [Betaproteobacteria bacterium]